MVKQLPDPGSVYDCDPREAMFPICQTCGVPVERFQRWREEDRKREVYVAYCHGAKAVAWILDVAISAGANAADLLWFAAVRCDNCGGAPSAGEHRCSYDEELGKDGPLCRCCDGCQNACYQDT